MTSSIPFHYENKKKIQEQSVVIELNLCFLPYAIANINPERNKMASINSIFITETSGERFVINPEGLTVYVYNNGKVRTFSQ